MRTLTHESEGKTVAEVTGDGVLIADVSSALQLMMDVSYSGCSRIIFHQRNIAPAFFDLKTGLAGDILQKVSNYRLQIAIVGDFEELASPSLKAFIAESNRGRQVFFVKDVETALAFLTR
jgi:hypothetical protein